MVLSPPSTPTLESHTGEWPLFVLVSLLASFRSCLASRFFSFLSRVARRVPGSLTRFRHPLCLLLFPAPRARERSLSFFRSLAGVYARFCVSCSFLLLSLSLSRWGVCYHSKFVITVSSSSCRRAHLDLFLYSCFLLSRKGQEDSVRIQPPLKTLNPKPETLNPFQERARRFSSNSTSSTTRQQRSPRTSSRRF